MPARNQMSKVAEEEGFSRSTYGKHIRKAMYRIVQNSCPVLKLYDSGSDEGPKPIRRKKSR